MNEIQRFVSRIWWVSLSPREPLCSLNWDFFEKLVDAFLSNPLLAVFLAPTRWNSWIQILLSTRYILSTNVQVGACWSNQVERAERVDKQAANCKGEGKAEVGGFLHGYCMHMYTFFILTLKDIKHYIQQLSGSIMAKKRKVARDSKIGKEHASTKGKCAKQHYE